MFNACIKCFDTTDIAVMSAAVADYTPVSLANEKIKKTEDVFNVELKKTKDILKSLGEKKQASNCWLGLHWKQITKKNMP